MKAPPVDHYRLLGVTRAADAAEIKRAYRRLARKLHPDVNRRKDAAERMAEVNAAYHTLSNEVLKAEYDAKLRHGVPEAPPPPTAAGEMGTRHRITVVDFPSPVYSLSLSPDGREFAAACFDNVVRFMSARNGLLLGETVLPGGAINIVKYASRRTVVAGGVGERSARCWLIRDREVIEHKTKRTKWGSHLDVSIRGNRAVLGAADGGITVMNRSTGREVYHRWLGGSPITAVSFSTDGRLIAVGSNDEQVTLFEAARGVEYSTLGPLGAQPVALAFANDDSLLAAALADRTARVYELRTGRARRSLWGHDAPIEAIAFHPCGWILASVCRGGAIMLWNALSGKLLTSLGGHSAPLKTVCFSRDGRTLAAGGLDRTVSIWEIEVGAASRP